MSDRDFDRLSEGQRDCLRLVLAHLNSKEISRKLDISPHTVDQRLRGALKILQVSNRFEAARLFAEHERNGAYQSLIYQSSDIENFEQSVSFESSNERGDGGSENPDTGELKSNGDMSNVESGPSKLPVESPVTERSSRLPLPRYRGEKNELSTAEKLGWVIAIAVGAAVSFGGILAGLEALSRLSG